MGGGKATPRQVFVPAKYARNVPAHMPRNVFRGLFPPTLHVRSYAGSAIKISYKARVSR